MEGLKPLFYFSFGHEQAAAGFIQVGRNVHFAFFLIKFVADRVDFLAFEILQRLLDEVGSLRIVCHFIRRLS